MHGLMSWIVLIFVAAIALAIVLWMVQRRAIEARSKALTALARSRGWQFIDEDDGYARRWEGRPFARRGNARHIVRGGHRDRDFEVFEYSYTTTSSNGTTTTTTTNYFTVWTIALPAPVPEFSAGAEGVFGGKVAETFGFERVNIDDDDFNATFKIKCDDQQFGQRVLHPDVVELLKSSGPWDWRLTGRTMIAYQKGHLEASALTPRLDLMCDLLDRIPADAWSPRSS
jgi:hypothetical protein